MSVPAFIDLDESEQVAELRSYLKSKGADISEENSPDGIVADIRQIIGATDTFWKEQINEGELESAMNSIISLILLIPPDKSEGLVTALSEKLAKVQPGDKRNGARVRLLSNLFHGLDDRSPHRYTVYLALVKMAGQADLISLVNPNLDEIKRWVSAWDISTHKVQNLLRTLHEAFQECRQSEKATKVMIELLGTYTEENASQARDDAQKCIVTTLADPNAFLMDHLLQLKPVKFLEGELIHDLLTIFVSGKLSQYIQFYQTNKDFVNSIGLQHEQNMKKMRLLTFMQMAETRKEIEFDTIQQEMRIEADDVESFIIDVVRTKTVRAKVDQMARRVIISSTTHRTFGRQQWQMLREQLEMWQQNLTHVLASLQTVTPP
jgi:translation initiation factor 3 subunit M